MSLTQLSVDSVTALWSVMSHVSRYTLTLLLEECTTSRGEVASSYRACLTTNIPVSSFSWSLVISTASERVSRAVWL